MASSLYPHEENHAISLKAGTATHAGKCYAANVLAGTKNLDYVAALNVLAGNKLGQYRDHEGVLNQLAGTKGWGANAAASRYAGLY